MNADDPRHGTNAGYQAHLRDGEGACKACRAARAARSARMSGTPRTSRSCGWCGRSTFSPNAVCSLCVTTECHADKVPDWTHSLYGGDWQLDPVRRVQVWVPWVESA